MAKPPLEKDGRQGGIRIHEESGDTIVGYRVPSLRACITLHLFDVISGYLNINQCTNCLRPFISMKKSRKNQDNFCCKKCGNYYRTKKNRDKARLKALKEFDRKMLAGEIPPMTEAEEKRMHKEESEEHDRWYNSKEFHKRQREIWRHPDNRDPYMG